MGLKTQQESIAQETSIFFKKKRVPEYLTFQNTSVPMISSDYDFPLTYSSNEQLVFIEHVL